MSAHCLLIYKGKVLLLLRDNKVGISSPNTWGTIGGGIEKDETPLSAAIREIKEETNVDVNDLQLLQEFPDLKAYLFYCFLTDSQVQQIKLGDEGQKLEFKSLEEIIEPNFALSEGLKKYLPVYKDKIVDLLNEST